MESINKSGRLPKEQVQSLLSECRDILFDSALVMMHSIDENGVLVKVNRRWLDTFGYQLDEVLGRKSTDFLTEASRAQALAETLPLFRETGRAHSIGYSFVHKSGRVLDLLLDAVTSHDRRGGQITLAALRDRADLDQWRWAASTLKTLKGLDQAHLSLDRFRSSGGPAESPEIPGPQPDGSRSQEELMEVAEQELVVLTDDITAHLQQLTEIEEQRFHEEQNSLQVLYAVADTIRVALAA